MLPDDIPKPPWVPILLTTAAGSAFGALLLSLLLKDLLNPPTRLASTLLNLGASIAGLLAFAILTVAAIIAAIAYGYWKQHRTKPTQPPTPKQGDYPS